MTLLPADADTQVANARAVRRQLASEDRCQCEPTCEAAHCDFCDDAQPACQLTPATVAPKLLCCSMGCKP